MLLVTEGVFLRGLSGIGALRRDFGTRQSRAVLFRQGPLHGDRVLVMMVSLCSLEGVDVESVTAVTTPRSFICGQTAVRACMLAK